MFYQFMNMIVFYVQTHPSVRIKGTENNYNPVRCMDHRCQDSSVHMHCPFCVKRDFYHDPVILKAHFRVKHVDKGIDFAGLCTSILDLTVILILSWNEAKVNDDNFNYWYIFYSWFSFIYSYYVMKEQCSAN